MSKIAASYWMGVCCSTDRDHVAIRSWFGALVPEAWTVLKADILTRTADDKELKIRALFRRQDGGLREATRSLGRRTVVGVSPPSPGILKDFREPLTKDKDHGE